MTVQISIIGLGQIGASIGLALAEHSEVVKRVGFDLDDQVAERAKKMGAVDKTAPYIEAAVCDVDLVILALPMNQVRETIETIAPLLKEGTVLMDTAPIKGVVASWASELLPEGRSYVGLTPVLNPKYLHSDAYGIEAAQADMFHDGMLAIVASPGCGSNALKLAAELADMVGAAPLFADLYEMDGLMAATHVLPQLMSAALLNATLDQPGWREARKVAGRAYAEISAPVARLDDPGALAATALLNRENVLRALDNVLAALRFLRQDIDQAVDTAALEKRLQHALMGRDQWWKDRQGGDWLAEELPKVEAARSWDYFRNMFGFGRKKRKRED